MALSEQEIIRREKLEKLSQMGINAFPAEEYSITDTTESIKQNFQEGKKVKLAGRLVSRRIQGKSLLRRATRQQRKNTNLPQQRQNMPHRQ